MPGATWSHGCCASGLTNSGSPTCPACGATGTFSGWRLSVIEMMAAYGRRTGMRAVGPHRALAHELLSPLLTPCLACGREGVVGTQPTGFSVCPVCDMGQSIPRVTDDVFEAARQEVIYCYPDAAVPGWRPLSERTKQRQVPADQSRDKDALERVRPAGLEDDDSRNNAVAETPFDYVSVPANRLPGESFERFKNRISANLMQKIKGGHARRLSSPRGSANRLSQRDIEQISLALFPRDITGV